MDEESLSLRHVSGHFSSEGDVIKSFSEEAETCFGLSTREYMQDMHPRNLSWETIFSFLRKHIPVEETFSPYRNDWKNTLKADLLSSMTLTAVYVCQSFALALIAGLPPVYGLYSCFVPLVIFPFFTTSRHLTIGATTTSSLMIAVALAGRAVTSSADYISMMSYLSFLVGVFYLVMAFLQLGPILEILMTYPILNGRLQATALIIIMSQMKGIFAIKLASPVTIQGFLNDFIPLIKNANPYAFAYGIATIVIIIGGRKIEKLKQIPWFAVVITGCTLVSFLTNNSANIPILGSVPQGLPIFASWSASPNFGFLDAATAAVSIGIVNFVEGLSLAKKCAAENHYSISVNQELVAVGVTNIIGSFFQSSVSACGVSRSNVSYQSGAKTPMVMLLCFVNMIMILEFFTYLFTYTPLACLSGVIIAGVVVLLDLEPFKFLWIHQRSDFYYSVVNLLLVLFLGVQTSIFVSIMLSLFQILLSSKHVRVVRLSCIPHNLSHSADSFSDNSPIKTPNGSHRPSFALDYDHNKVSNLKFRDVKVYPEGILPRGILLIRFDQILTAFNVSSLLDFIDHFVTRQISLKMLSEKLGVPVETSDSNNNFGKELTESVVIAKNGPRGSPIQPSVFSVDMSTNTQSFKVSEEKSVTIFGSNFHTIILDCDRILSIDSTAYFQLQELLLNLTSNGIKIFFVNARRRFCDSMASCSVKPELRPYFSSIEMALCVALNLSTPSEVICYLTKNHNPSLQHEYLQLLALTHWHL